MRYIKLIFKVGFFLTLLSLLSIIVANSLVEKAAKEKVYDSVKEVPYNKVGLLLGTGKILSNGRINLYYRYRIDAAAKLYKNRKIEYVLVSGDNSTKDYDEPSTIKDDLIAKGIPAEKIYLDYAGFRTLDSVVRCKEIFGQQKITVVSQQFHNERAIYIATKKNINAIGFNAKDVNIKYGLKTRLRERLARVKMVVDLVFGKKPKFLGNKIEIK
ncbi:vancomycin high temperature exclusion protein [Carboxylicivirga sp. M1479]|uniref:SanA/YdcF family protein n=1 Tax=Carboxylicivirga sp. M1479 TaxID=2594476 RepID=UPI001178931B|nr:ElyC/SanA/YdcF family protein [Carboxylicivirga sp. M1479]TRX65810.1 vancomycin high temperature exclusion protein [Carboxylicivirga sp. M1479]